MIGIRQLNSEPIERGGFFGCRLQVLSGGVSLSSYSIWISDVKECEWELGSIEMIDDLIDMLKELREVDESDCT